MAGFLLAVNTFAWFVFITNGDGKINADVIAWDIAFIDEESQTELLDIELEDNEKRLTDHRFPNLCTFCFVSSAA